MARRVSSPIQSHVQALLLAAGLMALAVPVFGQTGAPAPKDAVSKPLAYDVVSIRPVKEPDGNHWWTPTADGYKAKNVYVFDLIFAAYQLKCADQLIGLPKWAYEEPFDIDARMGDADIAAFQKLSNREQWEQSALMLRPVLAERFRLKIHHETRVIPVYDLVVARGGFKLKPSQAPENLAGMMTNRGLISIRGGPIGARFIAGLSDAVGRIVVDKTGLAGNYDITLKWAPDEMRAPTEQQASTPLSATESGPSVFTALQEQLGLKLVPAKAPEDILVVDHVERPSPN